MSKKKEKLNSIEKEVLRRIKKYSNSPFFTNEPIQQYCERIKKEANGDCNDSSHMNFNERKQLLPSGTHQFAEAVVMINPKYADHSWIHSGESNTLDAEAYIGKIKNPILGVQETRAFWRRRLEDTGEDQLIELESLYTVALVNHSFNTDNEKPNATENYALITCFTNNSIVEWVFYEIPSIDLINGFISYISAALKANPEMKLKFMPTQDVFIELISKLTIKKNNRAIPPDSENNYIFDGRKAAKRPNKKYDKQFKIEVVKRIKQNQLTNSQAAKELGINRTNLIFWIREYESLGEEAFSKS